MANKIATHGVVPDVTFVLDLDTEIAAQRRRAAKLKRDRIEIENGDFYARVRNGYLQLAHQEKERIVLLDGKDEISSLSERIWTIIERRLPT